MAQIVPTSETTDSTAIDRVVRILLDAKATPAVPATPQLASTAKLDPAKALAPDTAKADTAKPEIAVATAKPLDAPAPSVSPAPKLAALEKPVTAAPTDAPKADTRIDATAAAAPATSDPAANPAALPAANQAAPVAAPRVVATAYQQVANPINMGQVAFEMAHQMHAGQSRFTIRMDPPELGRVDVRMHVDASGTVNARLTVERAETLDLFQRDQRSLERALTQAGVDGGKANLEFSLKQNPFAGMTGGDQRPQNGQGGSYRYAATASEDAIAPACHHPLSRHRLGGRRQSVRLGASHDRQRHFRIEFITSSHTVPARASPTISIPSSVC